MNELVYEKWVSTDNQEEIHYFLKNTDIYVFGFNPNKISKNIVEGMLHKHGFFILGERKRNDSRTRHVDQTNQG